MSLATATIEEINAKPPDLVLRIDTFISWFTLLPFSKFVNVIGSVQIKIKTAKSVI